MNAKPAADLLVRAERVRTMDPMAGPVTALAIRDGKIAVTAGPGEERDLLETWNGPETVMLDDAGLVVLPAFVDTHNHLMLAARNILGVPVSGASDISQIVALVRERAAHTPPGKWIITAADWHELQLAERRLPTCPPGAAAPPRGRPRRWPGPGVCAVRGARSRHGPRSSGRTAGMAHLPACPGRGRRGHAVAHVGTEVRTRRRRGGCGPGAALQGPGRLPR
jgi:hypothetical protein